MAKRQSAIALIRWLPPARENAVATQTYLLVSQQVHQLGRDADCWIVFADDYRYVSRYHAEIRPRPSKALTRLLGPSWPQWEIQDLGSSNGTYVNGVRLRDRRVLQHGDRIVLGPEGPELQFEYQPPPNFITAGSGRARSPRAKGLSTVRPVAEFSDGSAAEEANLLPALGSQTSARQHSQSSYSQVGPEAATFTQLLPIVSTGRALVNKAYLLPILTTVVFVVMMFTTIGDPEQFNRLLAAYLALASYYIVVYQLCGKHKPWWVLFGAGLMMIAILNSPVLGLAIAIFRELLPGQPIEPGQSINFISLFIRMWFGAGLMEELLKAIPVLMALSLGKSLPRRWRSKVGVQEPLDGILLGAASAVGFVLVETLGHYAAIGGQVGPNETVQILIPRVLGSVAGHMAYSGYLGYFIGLSALKRRQQLSILAVGYFSAATLHALWNTAGFAHPLLLALIGMLSYAFLAAAILKARMISPTRRSNFATRISRPL